MVRSFRGRSSWGSAALLSFSLLACGNSDEPGGIHADSCLEAADAPDCPRLQGIVSAELLQAWIDDGLDFVLLDARELADFESGHLPGAQFIDPGLLRATVDGVDGQVADLTTVESLFRDRGIDGDEPVVIYADSVDTGSARVLWTLAYAGHQGSGWILDGGLPAWETIGGETESEAAASAEGSFAGALDPTQRVDGAWVFDHLDDPEVIFVDARSAEEFSAGRIPGARQVEWGHNLSAEGAFLSPQELRALHEAAGPLDPEATMVVYCRTGSRAAVSWLVLRALGFEDVRLYDGSWTEWEMNPNWPIESD